MKDFKEDCIWMSYRYCIGRKSIAACTHAYDIIKYGLDWISENRKEFTAKDIRSSINDHMRWSDNIEVCGYDNKYDVLSCIIKYLIDNNIADPKEYYYKHKWIVNVNTGSVCTEDWEGKLPTNIFTDYSDYEPWIKLAELLDKSKHINIKTKYNDVITQHECIKLYRIDYQSKLRIDFVDCNLLKINPYLHSYINKEYIIDND